MKTLLLLLCLLAMTSCIYEPEGEFIATPTPVKLDGVIIDIHDITDTLFVYGYVQVTYTVTNIPAEVPTVGVNAYLGDTHIYTGQNSGVFVIDPYQHGTGVYKCTVQYVSTSGSGSLAEVAGKEFVTATKQFVVVIDIDYPEPAVITSIDSDNGRLNIHWTKCTKRNFGSYTVVRHCSMDGNYYQACGYWEIKDANTTSWTDEDFVGGSVKYSILTVANEKMSYGAESRYDFFPRTEFTIVGRKAVLRWDMPRHYANTIEVTLSDFLSDPFESLTMTDTLYETSFLPGFGQVATAVQVTYQSQSLNRSYFFPVPYYIGERHDYPKVQPEGYSPVSGHYYAVSSIGLDALSKEYEVLTPDYNYNSAQTIALSANGEFLVGHNSADPARPLQLLNLESVEPDASLSLTNVFGSENLATIYYSYERLSSNLSVGNNGCVALSTGGGSRIYKLPGFDEVFSGPQTYAPFVISTSGNYAYLEGAIYKYDGSAFGKILNLGVNPLHVLSDKDDNFILVFPGNVKIVDSQTGSTIRQISIPFQDYFRVKYDHATDLLLCGRDQSYCLVNIGTGDKREFEGHYNIGIVNGKLYVRTSSEFYSLDPQFYFQP